ncbi:MAG: hypothetical protein Alpg2KO_31640 [Alphaproteobacteria bacterium]
MSIIRFPPDLPAPLANGFSEGWPQTTIRTEMETGPAKLRRRFTAAPEPLTVRFRLNWPQLALLKAWHDETLSGGVLAFVWAHPRTGEPAQFRFTAPPGNPRAVARGRFWEVELQLEKLP